MHHVTHDKTPKLFIVKGKRQPVVRELPTISWNEFNDGDAFVLDAVDHIFVWNGRQANRLEKLQAAKVRLLRRHVYIFRFGTFRGGNHATFRSNLRSTVQRRLVYVFFYVLQLGQYNVHNA
ncbi:MAG: hypothetical protein ABGX43_09025 [Nitrospinaceae bacterium]